MNAILRVFALLLFAIFSQGGVEKCYICDGDCMDVQKLEEKMCESDDNTTEYLCQASSETTINAGDRSVESTRECVPNTEETIKDCNALNKKESRSCYTCNTDLCNKYIPAEEDLKNEKIDQGKVKKCYFCKGECEKPQEKTCNIKGTTDYLCMAAVGITDDLTVHVRDCMPNTVRTKEHCQVELSQMKGYSCYTCEWNLCNEKSPMREEKNEDTTAASVPVNDGVKECYFCEAGLCLDSQVVSCDDIIKTNYVCLATVVENEEGVEVHSRYCAPNTRKTKSDCENLNSWANISCYTCNRDLCNNKAEKDSLGSLDTDEDEGGVKECYNCTGWCSHPRREKCDVKNYLCQESKLTKGDVTVYERTCVENTKEKRESCKRKNTFNGSSCYTCNTDLCNNVYATKNNGNIAGIFAPATMLTTLALLFMAKLLTM